MLLIILPIVIIALIIFHFTSLSSKLTNVKEKETQYITGYKSINSFNKRYTLEPGIKIAGLDIPEKQFKDIKNLSKAMILCNQEPKANFFVYNVKDKTLTLKTYE